jgi:hypothetical protein
MEVSGQIHDPAALPPARESNGEIYKRKQPYGYSFRLNHGKQPH